jgi:hypothetical protein
MTELRTYEEIGSHLDALACEYTQIPSEDPRHVEIENEISALCLQRYILQRFINREERNTDTQRRLVRS